MVVTSNNFIADILYFIKNSLSSGGTAITDPIANSRPAGSAFVMTSYPQRLVVYPLIIIKMINQKGVRAGMQTEAMDVEATMEIRVWARNQKEKDNLSNQVFYVLRNLQYDASGSVNANLHDFALLSDVEIDEPGEGNPKSRIIQIKYRFYNI